MNQPIHSMLSRLAVTVGAAALAGAVLAACGGGASGSDISGFGLAWAAKLDAQFEADVPPAIAFQPHSLLVKEGEPAMFGVIGVMGGATAHLRYQWRRDGVDIPGADKDYLILGTTSLGDDGAQYSVVITNAAGQAVSQPGVLAVVRAGSDLAWR